MINNNETIEEYITHNKLYVPEELYSGEYGYLLNDDVMTIITNENCYTQYNTTYCDCIKYNVKYNIVMNSSSCNINQTNNRILNQYISTNINDSYRITRDYTNNYIIYIGMMIIIILVVQLFKKNSRSI